MNKNIRIATLANACQVMDALCYMDSLARTPCQQAVWRAENLLGRTILTEGARSILHALNESPIHNVRVGSEVLHAGLVDRAGLSPEQLDGLVEHGFAKKLDETDTYVITDLGKEWHELYKKAAVLVQV